MGVHSARIYVQARIIAGAGVTLFVYVAVTIGLALERRALFGRLATISIRTQAQCPVISYTTEGILTAGIISEARIQALSIDARVIVRAVRVTATACYTGVVFAKLSCGTCAGITSDATLACRTQLTAGTLGVMTASFGAKDAKFVTLAVRVAALKRLIAARQRITLVAIRTAALDAMIYYIAFGAVATLARI